MNQDKMDELTPQAAEDYIKVLNMIRKLCSVMGCMVAVVLLSYVGWTNWEVGNLLDQGVKIVEPSKFFTEQFVLLAMGLLSGLFGIVTAK